MVHRAPRIAPQFFVCARADSWVLFLTVDVVRDARFCQQQERNGFVEFDKHRIFVFEVLHDALYATELPELVLDFFGRTGYARDPYPPAEVEHHG